MGGFDLVIIAICLISMAVGMMRGFVKEALSLISWILAIWLAINFSVEAGEFIHQYVQIAAPKFREWAGFVLIFIGTLFALALVSYVINKLVVRGPVKHVDRALGIIFGLLRGAAIVVVLLMVARAFAQDETQWWKNSQLVPNFIPVMDFVEEMLPESLQREVEEGESLQERVQEKVVEGVIESTLGEKTDAQGG